MRILFFTEGRFSPATRFRVLQYIPYLEARGIECEVKYFRNNAFPFGEGLSGPVSYFISFKDIVKRCFEVLTAAKYDIAFFQRELLPWNTTLLERIISNLNNRIIFDFDDPIYLSSVGQTNSECKIRNILQRTRIVTVSNRMLKEFAEQWAETVVIPMAVDTEKFTPRTNRILQNRIHLGWIGTPTNFPFLNEVKEVLRVITRRKDIEFTLISAKETIHELDDIPVNFKKWTETTEIEILKTLDIGILPLRDTLQAKGKFPIKLLQYMSIGIPVVCSKVGVPAEIIKDGVNGFLAGNDNEWIYKLNLLIGDSQLRKRIGEAARATVEENYSVNSVFPKLLSVFDKIHH